MDRLAVVEFFKNIKDEGRLQVRTLPGEYRCFFQQRAQFRTNYCAPLAAPANVYRPMRNVWKLRASHVLILDATFCPHELVIKAMTRG